jgi:hypothetical protein
MSAHPLVLSLLELDAAVECLLRRVGSRREHVRVRDALTDLHVHTNEVVVRDVAQGHGDLTIESFEDVVKRAHEAGLPYPELVAAFHRAQGGE